MLDGVPASAVSATVGSVVIFGISKDMPASGRTPVVIASIALLVLFASPLMTVVSWRVGINPALSVVSAAARTYSRASSDPSDALIVISSCFGAEKSKRGFV